MDEVPRISLSGFLSLVEWLNRRSASGQGGIECGTQKTRGIPSARCRSRDPIGEAVVGPSRASSSADTSDTEPGSDSDGSASSRQGGDA
jgi:hypothetical protein